MSSFKSLLLVVFAVTISSSNAFIVCSSSSSRPSFIQKDTFAASRRTETRMMTHHSHMTESSLKDATSTMLYSKTQLQFRIQDEDDYLYTDTSTTPNAVAVAPAALHHHLTNTVGATAPNNIFLPQASQNVAQRKKVEELMDVEMVLGRLAMVAAVLMFSNEVLSLVVSSV